ncbi:10331_t:CDS:2 [Gigaspora margarita]|uniref:10331_t:CDS:1 n=1 Tax=Gigaspora margarita TaxID=4874 RepID=A0ABN7V316_GIGMA|nr:10331_t:CDS:2 [Gigaspora margarita]
MKINNFTLPRFSSFRGQSEESEHVLTFDNHPWISTRYFKFKLITSERDKEMTMVMKTDRIINLPYVNSFNFADDFDIVHVSVSDLVDEQTAMREAISLRYIYTDHFDMLENDIKKLERNIKKKDSEIEKKDNEIGSLHNIINFQNEVINKKENQITILEEKMSSLQVKYDKYIDNNWRLSNELEIECTEVKNLRKKNNE